MEVWEGKYAGQEREPDLGGLLQWRAQRCSTGWVCQCLNHQPHHGVQPLLPRGWGECRHGVARKHRRSQSRALGRRTRGAYRRGSTKRSMGDPASQQYSPAARRASAASASSCPAFCAARPRPSIRRVYARNSKLCSGYTASLGGSAMAAWLLREAEW